MSTFAQTFSRTNLREYAYTMDSIRRERIDHVFSHSPLLAILAQQTLGEFGPTQLAGAGHKVEEGGHSIIFRVTLGEYAGAGRMAGPYGKHNVTPDDNTRLATANWTFYQHGLAVAEHEVAINRGPAAIANFLSEQTEEVMLALANLVADDFYATATPTNGLTPLDELISADNTAIQSINPQSDDTSYASRGVSAVGTAPASVSFASGSFAAQGIADMRTAYNNASEGLIQPNVILTEYDTHERYEGALQPQERFQGAVRVADGSFGALAFRTVPVLADRKCTSGAMYFLRVGDEKGVQFVALRGFDFDFGEWKMPTEQNTMVRPLKLTCQLTIGNRQYGCNKLTGITD